MRGCPLQGRYDMPEWVLWVLFVVVLLPVAALCLALIYALSLASRVKTHHHHTVGNVPFDGSAPESVTCDTAHQKKETSIENP